MESREAVHFLRSTCSPPPTPHRLLTRGHALKEETVVRMERTRVENRHEAGLSESFCEEKKLKNNSKN